MNIKIVSDAFEKLKKDIQLIRSEVFEKEQQISKELLYDDVDNVATHYVMYSDQNDIPIGSLRLYEADSDLMKLGRVAILKKYRGAGLGRKLVLKAIIDASQRSWIKAIKIEAQKRAQTFWTSCGFVSTGEETKAAGIEHLIMVRNVKQ